MDDVRAASIELAELDDMRTASVKLAGVPVPGSTVGRLETLHQNISVSFESIHVLPAYPNDGDTAGVELALSSEPQLVTVMVVRAAEAAPARTVMA